MTDYLWLNIILILGAVGAAEEAVRRIIGRPLIRTYRKFERFLDAWNGEPARDGLPARPGLITRVIAIEAQVHNNGGSSMKDAVDRIEKASRTAASMATATKEALDAHVEQSRELIEQGKQSEQEIRGTIATLADAVKIAAQSTPPEGH
jgi:hypothetical protein